MSFHIVSLKVSLKWFIKKFHQNVSSRVSTFLLLLLLRHAQGTPPPLDSQMGWTGEHWLKTNLLNWMAFFSAFFFFLIVRFKKKHKFLRFLEIFGFFFFYHFWQCLVFWGFFYCFFLLFFWDIFWIFSKFWDFWNFLDFWIFCLFLYFFLDFKGFF